MACLASAVFACHQTEGAVPLGPNRCVVRVIDAANAVQEHARDRHFSRRVDGGVLKVAVLLPSRRPGRLCTRKRNDAHGRRTQAQTAGEYQTHRHEGSDECQRFLLV